MQLTTFLSTASAIIATASARSAVSLNKECNLDQPYARIINRCDYDVYLWSVFKGDGCPDDEAVVLKTGETYAENYLKSASTGVGVSIKISKSMQCKGTDITQLEYFIDESDSFGGNYLDVSYVDCGGMDCPARKDGYYLVAGDQVGKQKAGADNTWCPILACDDAATCDTMSYVLPDDKQTKTCTTNGNTDFYLCGSQAPGKDSDSKPKPQPSSSKQPESSATPSSTSSAESSTVTPSPTPTPSPSGPGLVKTEIVYVTAYVNAKRHEHGRRHQVFHA
ncbi:hypothetical protein COCVIDRAFT_28922 [Bipolaris victoriae FI3]|uniref:Uncharacterized protein n=2 Tax=Bipolaris TaxID=33194 RepID=W6YEQ7_COCC2|nr:uncharacterized protein COCCADRAFT_34435 [Bipolaris zeicola 26-R-13]XP_014553959.1 hypothetical protein COCVIDRAFT_28922 [Bipolaris victoriae FI3]EUC36150.1 hypothetical protein COCCADRAFT_34435 [Bipolaris zeicola 26-R-13]